MGLSTNQLRIELFAGLAVTEKSLFYRSPWDSFTMVTPENLSFTLMVTEILCFFGWIFDPNMRITMG